jgi:serine protease Do
MLMMNRIRPRLTGFPMSQRRRAARSAGRGAAGAVLGIGLILFGGAAAHADDRLSEVPPVPLEALRQAESLSTAFKYVARTVSPAVVHITAIQRRAAAESSDGQDSVEEELFRRFFGTPPGSSPQRPRERRGSGSGVIVGEEGFIVTNNHVVAGADELRVQLGDGREFPATVVGTDPETDLAVLRIEAPSLTVARLGDSEVLEAGDWVIAIGNPFGLSHTVTSGIVSAIGRADMGLTTFENFIQTDAAINPGNSGGPLLNLRGEVVGINTAITTRTGGNQGIGFAVPSSTVSRVMDGLLRDGRVERGWLGIVMQPIDRRVARSLNIDPATGGVLIAEVVEGGPAAESGLRPMDLIVSIDGQVVRTQRDLLNRVGDRFPGEIVEIGVRRRDDAQTLQVRLGMRPSFEELASGGGRTPELPLQPRTLLGMNVQPITPAIRERMRLEAESGLVVTAIDEGSEAASAGIMRGDVILNIGEEPAASVQQLRDAIDSMDSERGLLLRVQRGSTARILVLGVPDPT